MGKDTGMVIAVAVGGAVIVSSIVAGGLIWWFNMGGDETDTTTPPGDETLAPGTAVLPGGEKAKNWEASTLPELPRKHNNRWGGWVLRDGCWYHGTSRQTVKNKWLCYGIKQTAVTTGLNWGNGNDLGRLQCTDSEECKQKAVQWAAVAKK